MDEGIKQMLMDWAAEFNDPVYFLEDPISFPRHFAERGAGLQDVEIAAVFASHLAWGRRSMIVRDCTRLFDEMEWRPFDYVKAGSYRNDDTSLHRTVKWSEIAGICLKLACLNDIVVLQLTLDICRVALIRRRHLVYATAIKHFFHSERVDEQHSRRRVAHGFNIETEHQFFTAFGSLSPFSKLFTEQSKERNLPFVESVLRNGNSNVLPSL